MKNLRDTKLIPPSLQEAMTDFNLTLKDIDDMDYQEFKEFGAQLDEKQLTCLNGIVKNDRWKAHIFTVLDNAAFIANQK